MKKLSVLNIAKLAIVAALYAVLTLFIPDQYGPIQFRVAEGLNFLIFYDKRYAYALGLGCAIANVTSPYKLDIVIGTLQTILVLLLIYYITKNMKSLLLKYITLIVVFSLSMIIIAAMIWFDSGVPIWATYIETMLSEAFTLTITGIAMYFIQKKHLINLYLK